MLVNARQKSLQRMRETRPTKKTPQLGVFSLSGWRDLNSRPHGPEPVSEILNCSPHGLVFFITMWTTMSLKRSSVGSKIEFRVQQYYHFLKFDVPSYILLDLKKCCQASPSIANSILSGLPSPRYNPDQVHFSLI
jgi:hypothetical protein